MPRANPLATKLTQKEAFRQIRKMGCSVRKDLSGDYVVTLKGTSAATGYYTNDLEDAVQTARHMAGPILRADLENRTGAAREG